MYNKVDTNMNFVDREKETEKFWRENDIFKKSMENRKEGETYTFYDETAYGKRKTTYRTCRDTYHQGYDSKIPDHERKVRSTESRMGYPRSSGRNRSGETSWTGWKGSDRSIWS